MALSFNNCFSDGKDSHKLTKSNFIPVALCSEIPERETEKIKRGESKIGRCVYIKYAHLM